MRIVKIVRARDGPARRRASVPVWVTELSWPAAQGKTEQQGDFATTDAGQAQRLEAGLQLLADERRSCRIERVYWYTWLSVEGVTDSAFDYSGLRRLRDGQLHDAPALVDVPAPGHAPAGLREAPGRRAALPLSSAYASRRRAGTTAATALSLQSGRSGACCSRRWPAASRSRCCRSGSCSSRSPRPARPRPPARWSPASRSRARSRPCAGGSSTATARLRWRGSRWPAPSGVGRSCSRSAAALGAPPWVVVAGRRSPGSSSRRSGRSRARPGARAARAREPAARLRARLRGRGGRADRRAAARRVAVAACSPRARRWPIAAAGMLAGRSRPARSRSARDRRPPAARAPARAALPAALWLRLRRARWRRRRRSGRSTSRCRRRRASRVSVGGGGRAAGGDGGRDGRRQPAGGRRRWRAAAAAGA